MTFDPIFPWPVIALLAGVLLGLSWWTYRPRDSRRWLLFSLRIAGIAIALAAMLRPSFAYIKQERLSSTLVFLVDKSRSMKLRDAANNQSRWEAAKTDLTTSKDVLDRLASDVQIRWYDVGATAAETSLNSILATEADKDRTGLGDSLAEIQRQLAGQRLAAVVLLSDGTNTVGSSPLSVARQYRAQKSPIHTFGYGREIVSDQTRDLAARAIRSSPTVFAKNRMAVAGEFDVAGFAGQPVSVRLLFDGVEQSRGEFKTPADARRLLAELQGTPLTPGDVKLTLEATAAGDEQTANNAISTYVTVLSGGVSVLEIEGKYRYWEPKFLRWALDQSPDIDLTQLFLLEQGERRAEIPDDLFQPGRFDVLVLGDVAANQFSKPQLEKIAGLVEKSGMGLLMLGGYDSFGPGGWAETPLAAVLPVAVRPADAQRTEPLQMVPTDIGLRHYILRLAPTPQASQDIWKSLRPLDGSSSWSQIKPAAQLLAQSSSGVPLLAAQEIGAGRAIAFAADTTWRWRKDKNSIATHARFWRQLVLWLAKKEESGQANLKVSLASRRLAVGQSLPITVRAEEPDGTPIADAVVKAAVVLPDSARIPVDLFREGDDLRGTFWQTEQPGDLVVEVAAVAGTRDLGTQKVKFLVYAEDLESQLPAADLSSLEAIAKLTDGSFHPDGRLAEFLRSLKPKDLNLEVSQPIVTNLWDRWELLLVFLTLIGLEWTLRKKWGMV